MTKAQAAKLVGVLAAAYPSAKVGEDTAEVYETRLADLDFEVAQRAVAKLIDTSKFFPAVSEIREAAQSIAPKSSLRPLELPTKQQIESFYTLREKSERREVPALRARREPMSMADLLRRRELLKSQARDLVELDRDEISAGESNGEPQ